MLRTLFAWISFVLALSAITASPVFASQSSYTVTRGDTLYSIAQRTHVTVSQLQRLNHLSDANYLREGQTLRLMGSVEAPSRSTKVARQKPAMRKHVALRQARRIRHYARAWRSARSSSTSPTAEIAARQALWMATHEGSSASVFAISPAYRTAQRALEFELRLTHTALRYLGVPYAWGGESFSGVDCSGFVQAVFRKNGIELPRTADAQFLIGRAVAEAHLLPGDLVFFETYAAGASHVGIYLGAGRFVHASSSNGVRVDSLSETYYASRFLGARRTATI